MLSVLLLILKIIGIILLALLGTVLLVLLVPICYRVDVNLKDGDFGVKVNVYWLKVVLRFLVEYQKKVTYKFRVFGIKVVDSAKADKSDEEKEQVDVVSRQDVSLKQEVTSKQEAVSEQEDILEQEECGEDIKADNPKTKAEKKAEKAEKKAFKEKNKAEKKARREQNKAEKKAEKARKKKTGDTVPQKIKNNKYVKISRDDSFKPAFKHTWKLLKKTLKHILPRRMKGEIVFGIDNPAMLGEMYGVLAIFFGPSGRWLEKLAIVPDFERTRTDVDAHIYGHLTLAVLLVYFLRFYFNKDVKRVIKLNKE